MQSRSKPLGHPIHPMLVPFPIGLWHAVVNVVVVGLFAISWLVRLGTPNHDPDSFAVALEIAGVALLLVSGWLGGELVDRLGVGVDDRANANAPSSLTAKHA